MIRFILKVLLAVIITFAATLFYSRSWEHALFVKPLYRLDTDEKLVALTFDDGPSPVRTPPLLDLMKEHQVQATFFMLGQNIERYPEIAKRVLSEGHLIGNHSYDHQKMVFRSSRFMQDQIQRTDQLIRGLGQEQTEFMRPPGSVKYITLPLVLLSMKKTLVTGSFDPPSEYKPVYDAEAVAAEVVDNVQPGSIIYLHDGPERDSAAFIESVDRIISQLKAQDYTFVRLDHSQ